MLIQPGDQTHLVIQGSSFLHLGQEGLLVFVIVNLHDLSDDSFLYLEFALKLRRHYLNLGLLLVIKLQVALRQECVREGEMKPQLTVVWK